MVATATCRQLEVDEMKVTKKNLKKLSTKCYRSDYERTANPACHACHTDVIWTREIFDHNATRFSLMCAHAAPLFQSCHTNWNYHFAFVDFYQCNQAHYLQPTNPNHGIADQEQQYFRANPSKHLNKRTVCSDMDPRRASINRYSYTSAAGFNYHGGCI